MSGDGWKEHLEKWEEAQAELAAQALLGGAPVSPPKEIPVVKRYVIGLKERAVLLGRVEERQIVFREIFARQGDKLPFTGLVKAIDSRKKTSIRVAVKQLEALATDYEKDVDRPMAKAGFLRSVSRTVLARIADKPKSQPAASRQAVQPPRERPRQRPRVVESNRKAA